MNIYAIALVTHAINKPIPMPLKYMFSTIYENEINIILKTNSNRIRVKSSRFKSLILHSGQIILFFVPYLIV